MAIAQAQECGHRDSSGCENVALKNLENSRQRREEEEAEEGSGTLLFETLSDWEKELQRMGADGWRVSPANERFDMSTSLPKYLWVPGRFLDNELKRTFVHFNERRIPRLCWRHPSGSSLLRSASFHPDSDPEKEDMRSVERLMLAGHSQCIVVDVASDLPNLPEIQQSYARLWTLCLGLAGERRSICIILLLSRGWMTICLEGFDCAFPAWQKYYIIIKQRLDDHLSGGL
uniref:Myotubularin phosphatase domain-containing protein n=1 Tax=Anolis carolinensis TaxID=28377 RepID=H9GFZ0_ANOCA